MPVDLALFVKHLVFYEPLVTLLVRPLQGLIELGRRSKFFHRRVIGAASVSRGLGFARICFLALQRAL